jgi:hypothetical protein
VTASVLPRQWFLVECYAPGIERTAVQSAGLRARAASAELREEGHAVEYLGALLVPEDEVVFHIFSSGSACTVHEASVRACVAHERVVESIAVGARF